MKTADQYVTTYGIEVTEIVTEQDRKSYKLGVDAAKQLSATSFAVDLNLFMDGLVDTVNGRPIIE